ncbi:16S rRNA (guanine(527)-N(7))-methyltransferase RsmG [soil metagenome]
MSDVSRETAPLPDELRSSATEVFGDYLPEMERFAAHLAGAGVERGLMGPREVPRLWERHLINCGVVAPRIPHGASVADVGSGAGLPGLVWALMRPDISMTLIEPLQRRTIFLSEVVHNLGLGDRVTVFRGRADEVDATFDVVTARAVAALEKLARWCMPLVGPRGVLLALKGSSAPDEVDEARRTLQRLGGRDIRIEKYGDLEIPTTVVEVSR